MGCGSSSLPNADEFLGVHAAPSVEYSVGRVSTERLVLKFKAGCWQAGASGFTVTDQTGTPHCLVVPQAATVTAKSLIVGESVRVVIKDADGNAIACVRETKDLGFLGARIYCFKPSFAGQLPTSEKQDGLPLYDWAKVPSRPPSYTTGTQTSFEAHMANGNDKYRAQTPSFASPHANVEIMRGPTVAGCCLMDRSVSRVEASPGIYVREHVYDVTIAPNVDPVLMICLAIYVDMDKHAGHCNQHG
jgi:hypothetical protein